MVFSSIIFVFYFLPIVLLSYLIVPAKFKNFILVIYSLFFYWWSENEYLLIMIISIVFNYYISLLIDKYKLSKIPIITGVAFNLLLLIGFKYSNFLFDNLKLLLLNFDYNIKYNLDIHLPIGISFFTFQSIAYLIDLKRGLYKVQKSFINLSLYISLFPQLVAGPIVRYSDISKEIDNRKIDLDKITYGIKRFIYGFTKKVLIANQLGQVADQIFALNPGHYSFGICWLGAICYALQIYFDFSGYSDMAIGLGSFFGFKFPENFNYPYISKSIKEFWRRWHMTLSLWFRDYLYIPLGGNRTGKFRNLFNLFLVFLLCGLWHGASWTFLIWGIYHGFFLVFEKVTKLDLYLSKTKILGHVYTLFFIVFSWVIFRAEDMTQAFNFYKSMLGFYQSENLLHSYQLFLNNEVLLAIILGVIFSTPLNKLVFSKNSMILSICEKVYLTLAFLISISYIAAGTYNPFIYFRF